MPRSEKPLLIRIAALGFAAFITAAVIIANRGEGSSWWSFIHQIPFGDKLGHIGLFATLCFLCNLAFPRFRIPHIPRPLTATTFVLLILLSLEELSQAFIPTRSCDFFDWLADLAGLAIGQTAATALLRKSAAVSPGPRPPNHSFYHLRHHFIWFSHPIFQNRSLHLRTFTCIRG